MSERRYAANKAPLRGITAGSDFSHSWVYYPEGVGESPKNWTGYTGAAQLRKSATTSSVALQFGVTLGNDGTVLLEADAEDTVNLSGRYVWDLKITDSSGESEVLIAGTATVAPAVTK